ncbi:MAG: hypothetical protein ACI81R_000864 [Bradymonadia bacterium]|jgi:hypothetical protein
MSIALAVVAAALAALCLAQGRLPARVAQVTVAAVSACLLGLSVSSGGQALPACGFAAGAALAARGADVRTMAAFASLVAMLAALWATPLQSTALLALLVATVVWLASGAALALLLDGAGLTGRAQRGGVFFGIGVALLLVSWTRGGAFVPLDGVFDVVATATDDGPSAFSDHLYGRASWLVWWCLACCLTAIVAGATGATVAKAMGAALGLTAVASMVASDPAGNVISWVSAPGTRVGAVTMGEAAVVPLTYWAVFALVAAMPAALGSPDTRAGTPGRVALAGALWIVAAMLVHAWCWWVGEEATGLVWAVLPLAAGFATVGAAFLGAGRGSWGDELLRFVAYGTFSGALVVLLASS